MTQITKFDRKNAKAIQDEAVAALQSVAAKYGLTVTPAGGRIGDIEFTAKVSFKVADPKALEADARAEFNSYCMLYGLKPEHFGATFTQRGETWTICGLATSRSKYPIKAKNAAGKVMLFTDVVAKLVALQGAAKVA